VVTNSAGFDHKTMPFQHGAELAVAGTVLGVDPDDQRTQGRKKLNEPIQRRFEGLDRVPSPINEGCVLLTARQAAIRRRGDTNIAAAMQLEHQLGAFRAGHNDPMMLRATCELDHRFDDAFA
jgi:hypothetical protein